MRQLLKAYKVKRRSVSTELKQTVEQTVFYQKIHYSGNAPYLTGFCALFRKYGKDSLLLAVLAYHVGPYKILGDRKHPKSKLLQKRERGERNIENDWPMRYYWCPLKIEETSPVGTT